MNYALFATPSALGMGLSLLPTRVSEYPEPAFWTPCFPDIASPRSGRHSLAQHGAAGVVLANQAEHHCTRTFEQEFLALLRNSGIPYDSRVFG